MSIEELLTELEHSATEGVYFEIDCYEAETLLEYIHELESAANDPRHTG